jgi:uncharacterized protein (TIGR03067 family)
MRFASTLACLVLTLVAVPVHGDGAGASKTRDGTWLAVSGEIAGQKYPDEIVKATKLIIKGEKYTVEIGKERDEGTCTADSSKSPMELDIKSTVGPNKGRTILAIYELKDDTMRVCYDLSGKARPTEFATKPKTQLFMLTYKRQKP